MSLLRKLGCRDDLFKQKDGKKPLNSDQTMRTATNKIPPRTLTEKEVGDWAREKAAHLLMLRDWLIKQPHLPQNLTDEQLLVFLHSSGNSVEMTKTRIDSHFTIRTHAPEIFTNRNMASKDIVQALRVARISPLPNATPDGTNAIFVDCLDSDADNFNFLHVLKATTMVIDTLVRYCPREEKNVIVLDMRNSVMAHVLKTNLASLKKAMLFTQTSLPFRLTEVHIINAFPLINQIQALIKPFINNELSNMIHTHMQDNMETFYKFFPKKYLPSDYGGEAASLQELNDALITMMKEQEHYLKAVEMQVVNESKRAGKAKSSGDVFGMEGSFRKLEFD